jgi:hypothetical protein
MSEYTLLQRENTIFRRISKIDSGIQWLVTFKESTYNF